MNIAYLDIEVSPMLGYTWGKYQQDVIEFERDFFIMCFAVKWNDGKKIEAYSLPDFPLYEVDPENDKLLVLKLWEVFDKADIIVAHNGNRFDIKKSNAKFIEHGLDVPSPYLTVDTLLEARKYFRFTSNKLDDIGKTLGVGRKIHTGGFKLWRDCMLGDQKSWKLMKRYNTQDVKLLYDVYIKLRPWMKNHPNITDLEERLCPNCGSKKLQSRGTGRTKTAEHKRYQCMDCGAWSRGKNITTSEIR